MDPQKGRQTLERQPVAGSSKRTVAAHGSGAPQPQAGQLQGTREPPALGTGHLPGDGTVMSWDVGPAWWGPQLGTAGQGCTELETRLCCGTTEAGLGRDSQGFWHP